MTNYKHYGMIIIISNIASFASFDHPLKHSVVWFANAGYSYDPKNNLIKCVKCDHLIDDLQATSEAILLAHKKWCPKCEFANNDPSANKSIATNTDLLKNLSQGNSFDILTLDVDKLCGKGASSAIVSVLVSMKERHGRMNGWKDRRAALHIAGALPHHRDNTDSGWGLSVPRLTSRRDRPSYLNWEIIIREARHPGLADSRARRNTFNGQEHKYQHLSISIEKFVDAGLYYKGPLDNVRCFYCDGGLKNFKAQDDPWTEHSRWFADCKFVVFKELELKNDASYQHRDTPDGYAAAQNFEGQYRIGTDHDTISRVPQPILNPVRTLEAREIKARLETPMVQRLLNMGYKREHIKKSLERRFGLVGDDYTSVGEIVEDILKFEGELATPKSFPSAENSQARSSQTVLSSSTQQAQNTGLTKATVNHPSNESHANVNIPLTGIARSQTNLEASAVGYIASGTTSNPAAVGESASKATEKVYEVIKISNTNAAKPLHVDSRIYEDFVNSGASSLTLQQVIRALKTQDIRDEELKKLWNEYETLTQTKICKVCLDKEINTVFLPCGHFVCCDECTPQLTYCCVCRTIIRGTVRSLMAEFQ